MNKQIASLSFLLLFSALAAPSIHCSEGQPEPGILSRLGSWLSRVYYEPFVKFVTSVRTKRLQAYQKEFADLKTQIDKTKKVRMQSTFHDTLALIQKDIKNNVQLLRRLRNKIRQQSFNKSDEEAVKQLKKEIKSLKQREKAKMNSEASNEKKEDFYIIRRKILEPEIINLIAPIDANITNQTQNYWGNMMIINKLEMVHQKMQNIFELFKEDKFYQENIEWIQKQQKQFVTTLHKFAQSVLDNTTGEFMIFVSNQSKPDLDRSSVEYKE